MILIYLNILFMLSYSNPACNRDDKVFPCSEYLEKKVAFWIDVFAKIPNTEGVLHCKDTYKVYKTIDVSNFVNNNKARSKYLSLEKKQLAKDLNIDEDSIRFQLGQALSFLAGLKRSYRYLKYIKEVFKEHDLPEDLAYLPHVESAFNYTAYSKVGAAGIWQFTYSTGKQYMKIDYTVDERKDPIKATVSAAKFLKKNYEKLKTWPIAITAYNHGPHGMQKAVDRHGYDFDDILQNYTSRSFGFASKNFYAEFLAVRHIANNENLYFKEVIPHDEYKYKYIKLTNFISINTITSKSLLTFEDIKTYNYSLRDSVLKGQRYIPKNFELRVPVEKYEELKTMLAHLKKEEQHSEQIMPKWHKVNRGDTLSSIAKNYNLSIDNLILANNINKNSTLRVGQVLEIPSATKLIAKIVKEKPKTKAPKKIIPEPEISLVTNTIEEEIDNNETKNNDLLVLYGPPAPPSKLNDNYEFNEDMLLVFNTDEPKNSYGYIRVQAEESISNISDWLLLPINTILKTNRVKGKNIYINQILKIYFSKTSKDSFEQKRLEYHKSMREDFFNNYKVVSVENYTMQKGDSLWNISNNLYNIPLWLLYMYNPNLDYTKINYKQEIKIPIIENK